MQTVGAPKPAMAPKNNNSAKISAKRTVVRPQAFSHDGPTGRIAAGLVGVATALSFALAPPSFAVNGPFLKSTGAKGLLAQEEEELYNLRQTEETKARQELLQKIAELEEETRRSQTDKFCATPFGIDVVGITEFVALTGALVGGISARRRKEEMERLNEQLRIINTQLRQQARSGTLFAPGLTYAPPTIAGDDTRPTKLSVPSGAVQTPMPMPKVPMNNGMPKATAPPTETAATTAANAGSSEPATVGLMSIDEEDQRPEVKQCQTALKEGKKLLKESESGPAMVRFEKALMLAKTLGDRVRERRAVRGLAAASRLGGQNRQAIKYLERVLEISSEIGDHVGDADAFGVIADIYTDIGEFEKAAEYYDKYIGQMNSDGPV